MKTKKFILYLLVSLLTLSLVSCEKDGDGDGKESLIVGEWRLYKDYEEGYGYEYYDEDDDYQYYLIFKSDGTCKIVEIDEGIEEKVSGRYSIYDDRLMVTVLGEKEVFTISSLTKKELVFDYSDEYGEYLEYYERVE